MLIALHAFLVGFPALFSIVDPISGAPIFRAATAQWPRDTHPRLARLVASNSFVVMIGRSLGRLLCVGVFRN
jgi:multiple antibiotic resistance protein